MKLSELSNINEMPKLINVSDLSKDLDYDNKKVNLNKFKKLKSGYKKNIKEIDNNIILYQNIKKKEFFVLDNKNEKLLYYMKFKIGSYSFLNSEFVYQIWVWRYLNSVQSAGIAADIFWEYLINITGIITMDSKQTELGQRFWTYRLQEAFNKKLNIYYIDANNEKNNKKLDTKNDLDNILSDLYGNTKSHKERKILISKTPLDIK